MNKHIVYGIILFLLAQLVTYFQLNGQFKWDVFKNNQWVLSLIGIPLTLLYLNATKQIVTGFDGLLWPGRFIGFGCGMVVFAIGTYILFNEAINLKTLVSISLATILICIQILWK